MLSPFIVPTIVYLILRNSTGVGRPNMDLVPFRRGIGRNPLHASSETIALVQLQTLVLGLVRRRLRVVGNSCERLEKQEEVIKAFADVSAAAQAKQEFVEDASAQVPALRRAGEEMLMVLLKARRAGVAKKDVVTKRENEYEANRKQLKELETALAAAKQELITLTARTAELSAEVDMRSRLATKVPPILDLSKCFLLHLPREALNIGGLLSLSLPGNSLSTLPQGDTLRCHSLRFLDMSHNKLTDVPATILQCPSLQRLNLSHNQLLVVPSALATLTALSQLQVNHNRIPHFRSLRGLSALQELWLNDNPMQLDTRDLDTLTRLSLLDASRVDMVAGCVTLQGFPALTLLTVQASGVHVLQHLGTCTALVQLTLSHGHLPHLPFAIGTLGHLTSLDCSYNELAALPQTLSALTRLVTLNLSHNALTSLMGIFGHDEEESGAIKAIPSLIPASSRAELIKEFLDGGGPTAGAGAAAALAPESFSVLRNLTALVSLDVSFNKIGAEGEVDGIQLEMLQQLTSVNLSHNRLSSLPPSVCNVAALQRLLASHNALTTVPSPEAWSGCERLALVDLSHNFLPAVPSFGPISRRLNLLMDNNRVEVRPARSTLTRYLALSGNPCHAVPVAREEPDKPHVLLERSVALVAANALLAALEHQQAVDCTHVQVRQDGLLLRARTLLRLHRPQEALAELDAVLAREPDSVPALATAAEAHLQLGRYTVGVDACRRALTLQLGGALGGASGPTGSAFALGPDATVLAHLSLVCRKVMRMTAKQRTRTVAAGTGTGGARGVSLAIDEGNISALMHMGQFALLPQIVLLRCRLASALGDSSSTVAFSKIMLQLTPNHLGFRSLHALSLWQLGNAQVAGHEAQRGVLSGLALLGLTAGVSFDRLESTFGGNPEEGTRQQLQDLQRCYGVLAKATLLNCRGRSSEAIQAMQGACDSIAGYLTTREPLPGPGWQS